MAEAARMQDPELGQEQHGNEDPAILQVEEAEFGCKSHPVRQNTQLDFKRGRGLLRDLQRRAPYYKSDWTDAFTGGNSQQSTASICFLFFACLVPAIAFGTIYDIETEGAMGVVECILASGFAGMVYSILSGQPLCILGGTGPNLAYTVAFYKICKAMDVDFLPCRVWQGLWCSLLTVIFAVTDASALMSHVTRYVEDIFSALISLIFIFEALKAVVITFDERGNAAGFLTALLCFGTYIMAVKLKALKGTTWLNPSMRFTISNFAVTIAILVATGVAQTWRGEVDIAWLSVPSKLEPTLKVGSSNDVRPWLINPLGGQGLNPEGEVRPLPTSAIAFAFLPGLGMALLNYLDQNLTSKLINRPAHGLKKPGGYHLDMMVLGCIIYPVVSIFGLPFPCAATVRSMAHLISLTTYEFKPIPGGGFQRVVVKVVEQRWTHFAIHALMLLSLLLSGVLKYVPNGALFGVFLFMGLSSVAGNQLFERMFLWAKFDPQSHPRLPYVTRLTTRQLHKFTLIQFICLAILYALKAYKQTAMVFPFFIALLVFVRKGLGRYFKEEELAVLDAEEDLPPDAEPKKLENVTEALEKEASEAETPETETPEEKEGSRASSESHEEQPPHAFN
jgi:hypothetical protein